MKIKINEKILCIPPHISATWDQVTFLQSEESDDQLHTLVVHTEAGKEIRIPNLDASLVDIAFSSHLKYLEKKGGTAFARSKGGNEELKTVGALLQQLTGLSPEQLATMPIRFGIAGMEGMPGIEVLQHNQAQANASDIPTDVLEKMSEMIKMMIQGDIASFPKPEPHCKCPHCQVARTLHNSEKEGSSSAEQIVSDEDLKFRDWEITRKADQLYTVTNPVDPKEHYSVYLGSPVGCTCGHSHCEHITAVLYSYN